MNIDFCVSNCSKFRILNCTVYRKKLSYLVGGFTVFARVICAFFFSILALEKSGCVKYADFLCGDFDLGFILI
jgi:hypothetical protein